jgi:DNA-binding CsgD family transcriptional regulator
MGHATHVRHRPSESDAREAVDVSGTGWVDVDERFVELLQGAAAAVDAALLRARPSEAAIALLEEAIALFDRLVAEVDALDDEPGGDRGAVTRRRCVDRPTFGWASLTPREERVVELVAEGLSTREIGRRLHLSPDTVKSHLTHVFAKLGASSRVEVAIAATRRRHLAIAPVALVG